MYAMQYRVGLPADYDMSIIRDRVRTRGHLLDQQPGLGLKAYLITEVGVAGATVNQYAPFYVWTDVEQMSNFLWRRGGFHGIVASFGRPAVDTWAGATFASGEAVASPPATATLRTWRLPAHEEPSDAVASATAVLHAITAGSEVHSALLAVDPGSWEAVQCVLWQAEPPAGHGERFEVLHLSAPHLPDLTRPAPHRLPALKAAS